MKEISLLPLVLVILLASPDGTTASSPSAERKSRSDPDFVEKSNHVDQNKGEGPFSGPSYSDPSLLSAIMQQAESVNFEYNYKKPSTSVVSGGASGSSASSYMSGFDFLRDVSKEFDKFITSKDRPPLVSGGYASTTFQGHSKEKLFARPQIEGPSRPLYFVPETQTSKTAPLINALKTQERTIAPSTTEAIVSTTVQESFNPESSESDIHSVQSEDVVVVAETETKSPVQRRRLDTRRPLPNSHVSSQRVHSSLSSKLKSRDTATPRPRYSASSSNVNSFSPIINSSPKHQTTTIKPITSSKKLPTNKFKNTYGYGGRYYGRPRSGTRTELPPNIDRPSSERRITRRPILSRVTTRRPSRHTSTTKLRPKTTSTTRRVVPVTTPRTTTKARIIPTTTPSPRRAKPKPKKSLSDILSMPPQAKVNQEPPKSTKVKYTPRPVFTTTSRPRITRTTTPRYSSVKFNSNDVKSKLPNLQSFSELKESENSVYPRNNVRASNNAPITEYRSPSNGFSPMIPSQNIEPVNNQDVVFNTPEPIDRKFESTETFNEFNKYPSSRIPFPPPPPPPPPPMFGNRRRPPFPPPFPFMDPYSRFPPKPPGPFPPQFPPRGLPPHFDPQPGPPRPPMFRPQAQTPFPPNTRNPFHQDQFRPQAPGNTKRTVNEFVSPPNSYPGTHQPSSSSYSENNFPNPRPNLNINHVSRNQQRPFNIQTRKDSSSSPFSFMNFFSRFHNFMDRDNLKRKGEVSEYNGFNSIPNYYDKPHYPTNFPGGYPNSAPSFNMPPRDSSSNYLTETIDSNSFSSYSSSPLLSAKEASRYTPPLTKKVPANYVQSISANEFNEPPPVGVESVTDDIVIVTEKPEDGIEITDSPDDPPRNIGITEVEKFDESGESYVTSKEYAIEINEAINPDSEVFVTPPSVDGSDGGLLAIDGTGEFFPSPSYNGGWNVLQSGRLQDNRPLSDQNSYGIQARSPVTSYIQENIPKTFSSSAIDDEQTIITKDSLEKELARNSKIIEDPVIGDVVVGKSIIQPRPPESAGGVVSYSSKVTLVHS